MPRCMRSCCLRHQAIDHALLLLLSSSASGPGNQSNDLTRLNIPVSFPSHSAPPLYLTHRNRSPLPARLLLDLIMSSITQSSESLTLAGAKIAVAAAEAKAREMGLGMNIAVVDASVWPLFAR